MTAVRLGINKVLVDVPDEMLAAYQNGQAEREELMQHAIRTGQAEIFDFTQRQESFMDIAKQSAMNEVARFGSNIRQAGADITGNQEASDAQRAVQERLAENSEWLSRQRPGATIVGQVAPYMAVPGGKVAQTMAGGIQGFLEGDTPAGRIAGAATGAALGFAGQKIGEKVGNLANRGIRKALGAVKEPARETLERLGIPMTLGQRTGDPLARFTERLKFVLTNRQPKSEAQKRAITRMVMNFLGEDGDHLSRQSRASINNRIGRVFQSAAKRAGERVQFDDQFRAAASAARSRAGQLEGSHQLYQTLVKRLNDAAESGAMDADQLLQLRKDLSRASAMKAMEIEVPELGKAIDAIDDQLARIAPDLAQDLSMARQQFRVFLATLRGRSIGPEGQINLDSFDNSLNAIFPSFKKGSPLPGQARNIGDAVDAMRQVVRPFRTSNTAENVATMAFPAGAGVLMSGGNLAGAGAGLLGLGAAMSGGGTGPLLGGGLSRGLIPVGQQYIAKPEELPTNLR